MAVGNIRHEAAPPTGRIMMLRVETPAERIDVGALVDGTVFVRTVRPGDLEQWRTLIQGPADSDAYVRDYAQGLFDRGGRMTIQPVEFGLDERIVAEIRADTNWAQNGVHVAIAFSMAAFAAGLDLGRRGASK